MYHRASAYSGNFYLRGDTPGLENCPQVALGEEVVIMCDRYAEKGTPWTPVNLKVKEIDPGHQWEYSKPSMAVRFEDNYLGDEWFEAKSILRRVARLFPERVMTHESFNSRVWFGKQLRILGGLTLGYTQLVDTPLLLTVSFR